jgi:hypothetical protein
VGLEAAARADKVVVVDQQQSVVGVGGVELVAEGEGVLGVQPADLRPKAVLAATDVDLRLHLAGAHCGRPFRILARFLLS